MSRRSYTVSVRPYDRGAWWHIAICDDWADVRLIVERVMPPRTWTWSQFKVRTQTASGNVLLAEGSSASDLPEENPWPAKRAELWRRGHSQVRR